ncbi:arylsulfatase [Novosphingobium sp. PS1R-30]|uniref:Arylsulfatase n=1 Tax=Novosphingobium anseongense TaxID=3133436 RepID=A0ABU8RUG3_9SPHN
MTRSIRLLLSAAAIATAGLGLAPAALAKPASVAQPARAARPNILLIVLDDVGFSDLGAFGSEIRTPNIDALAAKGLRYNHFDTKAICSPTRASLLTGRNNQTVNMEDLAAGQAPDPTQSAASRGELPRNAEMVPQALKAVGYQTFAIGKWHLAPGYDAKPGNTKASWPLQRGFDSFYGYLSGWTDQYKPDLVKDNEPITSPKTSGYHLTTDLADHAIAAFGARDTAPEGKPKFVYFAPTTAHAPIQVAPAYIDAYEGAYAKGWDAIRTERFERLKAQGVIPANTELPARAEGDKAWADLSAQEKTVFARFMATYAGFITHADEQIGRIVAHLKQTGQYDDTLIVLLSDNGGAPEGNETGGFKYPYSYRAYARQDGTSVADMARELDKLGGPETQALYQRPWAAASSAPFHRYKLWPFAGGSRTPLIVSWPDRIKAQGELRGQMVDVIDVGPTLLDAAGTAFRDQVDGVRQIPVAGRSISASFTSKTAGARKVQFFELRGNRAITSGRWKAVAIHRFDTDFAQDKWFLFDTATDFAEAHDVAARYPKKLRELQNLWWSEARKYSDPPLAEPSKAIRSMRQFDDELGD